MSVADSKGWVYVVQMGPGGPVKIGYSKTPYCRIRQLRIAWPYEPIILAVIAGDHEKERELHRRLRLYRLRGEWFSPADEVLDLAATCVDLQTGVEKEERSMSHRKRRERRRQMVERVLAGEAASEVARLYGVTTSCVRIAVGAYAFQLPPR